MRKDIKCYHCGEQEADYLIFYEKIGRGYKLFQHPSLICHECREYFKTSNRLLEARPIILSFVRLGKMAMPQVLWLASDKGKAQNDMACPAWRKKLFRIKKIGEGRSKAWVNQMPMGI